jgi:hypothetical protein
MEAEVRNGWLRKYVLMKPLRTRASEGTSGDIDESFTPPENPISNGG